MRTNPAYVHFDSFACSFVSTNFQIKEPIYRAAADKALQPQTKGGGLDTPRPRDANCCQKRAI